MKVLFLVIITLSTIALAEDQPKAEEGKHLEASKEGEVPAKKVEGREEFAKRFREMSPQDLDNGAFQQLLDQEDLLNEVLRPDFKNVALQNQVKKLLMERAKANAPKPNPNSPSFSELSNTERDLLNQRINALNQALGQQQAVQQQQQQQAAQQQAQADQAVQAAASAKSMQNPQGYNKANITQQNTPQAPRPMSLGTVSGLALPTPLKNEAVATGLGPRPAEDVPRQNLAPMYDVNKGWFELDKNFTFRKPASAPSKPVNLKAKLGTRKP